MTIIFDIFPSHGHQHACHKLAKLLKDSGHNVYFIGLYRYLKNCHSALRLGILSLKFLVSLKILRVANGKI